MYLHKDELEDIIQFLDALPTPHSNKVELEYNSTGIGYTLEAKVHGIQINGMTVTVTKMITDESSW